MFWPLITAAGANNTSDRLKLNAVVKSDTAAMSKIFKTQRLGRNIVYEHLETRNKSLDHDLRLCMMDELSHGRTCYNRVGTIHPFTRKSIEI